MGLSRNRILLAAAGILLGGMCRLAVALEGPADLATRYSEQVRAGLVVPADEARRYGRLADDALARAGILWDQPQYLLVVDRDPWVQAVFLLWRTEPGGSLLVGASPVSTGLVKGCIPISAALNRFLDRFGVLDADYEQAARDRSAPEAGKLWVLDPQREPVAGAGRYLVVVESGRSERPDWSPAPAPAPTPGPAWQ